MNNEIDTIVLRWRNGESLRSLAKAFKKSRHEITKLIKNTIGDAMYESISLEHLDKNKNRFCTGNDLHKKRRKHGSHPALMRLSIRIIKRRFSGGKRVSYRYIKIGNKKWISLARYLWERENGSVPVGYFVSHIDGNTLNDDLSNLFLQKIADNARNAVSKCNKERMSARIRKSKEIVKEVEKRKKEARIQKEAELKNDYRRKWRPCYRKDGLN